MIKETVLRCRQRFQNYFRYLCAHLGQYTRSFSTARNPEMESAVHSPQSNDNVAAILNRGLCSGFASILKKFHTVPKMYFNWQLSYVIT